MIPHFIDLLCRGLSLAALVWGVFSMGFSSAERKAGTPRPAHPDQQETGPAHRVDSTSGPRELPVHRR